MLTLESADLILLPPGSDDRTFIHLPGLRITPVARCTELAALSSGAPGSGSKVNIIRCRDEGARRTLTCRTRGDILTMVYLIIEKARLGNSFLGQFLSCDVPLKCLEIVEIIQGRFEI